MPNIYVHNTLSGKKELFVPRHEGRVNMYVCGITSYDECHLGHARCYVVFDFIRRYLEHSGFKVKYVQNFTDIDDKIINRSGELNRTPEELSEEYIKRYFVYSEKLNLKAADVYPRVTRHIGQIVEGVKKLIDDGCAYAADDGSVYFSVRKFPGYGKLSKRNIEEMKSGVRVELKENKADPLDFALWKSAKPDEPSWDSPWGRGRPGWHIECSVMSMQYLEGGLDIHGGGQDLIFPHHENEIAQSESLSKGDFSKYWIHNGFVTVNKEKMSKSLGNFFSLKDIFAKYDPMLVRYFLMSQHYRKPVDFSDEKLEQAGRSLGRITNAVADAGFALASCRKPGGEEMPAKVAEITARFEEAMNNDFNTEAAVSEIHNLCTEMNIEINKGGGTDYSFVYSARNQVVNLLENVLGIKLPEAGMDKTSAEKDGTAGCPDGKNSGEIPENIMEFVRQREKARKEKNYKEADSLRKQIEDAGYRIEDTPRGTVLK